MTLRPTMQYAQAGFNPMNYLQNLAMFLILTVFVSTGCSGEKSSSDSESSSYSTGTEDTNDILNIEDTETYVEDTTSASQTYQSGSASLFGQIKDNDTGTPIANARIEVGGYTAFTTSDGNFSLTNMASSDIGHIRISHPGYISAHLDRMIVEDKPNSVAVNLVRYAQFEKQSTTSWQIVSESAKITLSADPYVFNNSDDSLYKGLLHVMFYGYSVEENDILQLPNAHDGAIADGATKPLQILSAFYCQVKDAYNQKLDISSNGHIKVLINTALDTEVSAIPLWRYDDEQGLWVEKTEALRISDNVYEASVSENGLWILALRTANLTTVSSRLIYPDNRPANNITVYAVGDNWISNESRTDNNGQFTLEILPDESLTLMAYDHESHQFVFSGKIIPSGS